MPTLWPEDTAGTVDYTRDPERHTDGASSAAKADPAGAFGALWAPLHGEKEHNGAGLAS